MTHTVTVPVVAQEIEVLPERFVLAPGDDAGRAVWVHVAAPDGRITVRRDPEGSWRALFSGGTGHDLDVSGMTVSILAPLAVAGVSIFVASTPSADLVLVPGEVLGDAVSALREAGHSVLHEVGG